MKIAYDSVSVGLLGPIWAAVCFRLLFTVTGS